MKTFPEKDKSRAKRRIAEAKKFKKALRVADEVFSYTNDQEWKLKWARRHVNNLKACSCWLCCSPRENGEVTIQEKRFKESLKCEAE